MNEAKKSEILGFASQVEELTTCVTEAIEDENLDWAEDAAYAIGPALAKLLESIEEAQDDS